MDLPSHAVNVSKDKLLLCEKGKRKKEIHDKNSKFKRGQSRGNGVHVP